MTIKLKQGIGKIINIAPWVLCAVYVIFLRLWSPGVVSEGCGLFKAVLA
jgi:hypothetical protein